jgi:uncharacterized membrane protein YkvI
MATLAENPMEKKEEKRRDQPRFWSLAVVYLHLTVAICVATARHPISARMLEEGVKGAVVGLIVGFILAKVFRKKLGDIDGMMTMLLPFSRIVSIVKGLRSLYNWSIHGIPHGCSPQNQYTGGRTSCPADPRSGIGIPDTLTAVG